MSERILSRNDDYELDYVSGEELDRYLEEIVPGIGWVIVYFDLGTKPVAILAVSPIVF